MKDKEFMNIRTKRLKISELTFDMTEDVHKNSLDEDNRRFVPDEVFETVEDAEETVKFLISRYGSNDGPFVYPVILNTGENIGYVQLVKLEDSWEIGYHIAKKYTKNGYATEAIKAFLPITAEQMNLREVYGICLSDNIASCKVMEKCGFEKLYEGIGKYQGEEKNICKYIFRNQ